MSLAWIFLAIIIIFGIIAGFSDDESKIHEVTEMICTLFVIPFAIFALSGCIYSSYAGEHMTHIEKSGTIPIYSLSVQTNTESSISGGFFCVSGSCNGVDYYYMMQKKDDGYEKVKVLCDKSLIVESNGNPHVDCYSTKLNKDVSQFWFSDDKSRYENVVKYKIYVPKNSVKYEFKPN